MISLKKQQRIINITTQNSPKRTFRSREVLVGGKFEDFSLLGNRRFDFKKVSIAEVPGMVLRSIFMFPHLYLSPLAAQSWPDDSQ